RVAWEAAAQSVRTRIFQSSIAVVDDVQTARADRNGGTEGFSPDFQVSLPYSGLFIWHVGENDVVGDANQGVFVRSGEAYRLSEPTQGGYAELIVTPRLALLSDLTNPPESHLSSHTLFVGRSRPANLRIQNLRARFLHRATSAERDDVAAGELLLDLLHCATEIDGRLLIPGKATRRLIQRTKEFVEACASTSLRLSDVARAVGASPAYLTDVFRRIEGIPLHKYIIQLRLARALIELPHANELTQLALVLCFSSHC